MAKIEKYVSIFEERKEKLDEQKTLSSFLREFNEVLNYVELSNLFHMMSKVLKMNGYKKEAIILEKLGSRV